MRPSCTRGLFLLRGTIWKRPTLLASYRIHSETCVPCYAPLFSRSCVLFFSHYYLENVTYHLGMNGNLNCVY